MARDYTYDTKYQSSPQQIKNRVIRNKARRHAIKKNGAAAMKGKDVDHVTPLIKKSTDKGKTRVISVAKNRSQGPKIASAMSKLKSYVKK